MVADRVQLSLLESRKKRRPLKQGQPERLVSVAGIEGRDDLGAPLQTESEDKAFNRTFRGTGAAMGCPGPWAEAQSGVFGIDGDRPSAVDPARKHMPAA